MENYFFYAIAGIEFLLPLACIVWMISGRAKDVFAWIFRFITSGLWFSVAFLGLPWAYTSIYLRWVFMLLFVIAVVVSFRRIQTKKLYVRKGFSYYLGMMYILISMALALLLNISIINGFFPSEEAYKISSPLKGEKYIVIQGGQSGVSNLFHHYFKQRKYTYALDIVKLNSWGNRASGIAPDTVIAYEINADSLFCPCNGTVDQSRYGIYNNTIGDINSRQILGNFIKIDCGDFNVILAHLQPNSSNLEPGTELKVGDFIGLVGNSGYSIEPHLHMEGYVWGEDSTEVSVPLLVNGRFLSINHRIKQP